MTIFLDTANLDEIRKYAKWGIVKGVTTNPKILSRERDAVSYSTRIKEILEIVKVPVSVEITNIHGSLDAILREAREYFRIDPNHVVIKVPMFGDGRGLEIAHELLKHGIPVNMTCIISLSQAVLACELGCTYVSIFYNRVIDYLGGMGAGVGVALETVRAVRDLIDTQNYPTKIIAGSIRRPSDVVEAAVAGAHVITIPYKIIVQMPWHWKTEETIKEFDRAWLEFMKAQKAST